MSELPNQSSSGATPPSGGAGGDIQTPPPSGSPTDGDRTPVSWADHKRALDDLHRFKGEAKSAAAKMAELQSQIEEIKKQSLAQNKDFEALYNQERAKRQEVEQSRESLKGSVVLGERHRAAYPALKKAGLRDDAENLLDHLDLSDIEVEATSNGRFLCTGVEDFVQAVVKKYPYAFQKSAPPTVNGSSGNGLPAGEKWTPDRLYALERECKKKGDMAPYYRAHKEWLAQGKPAS